MPAAGRKSEVKMCRRVFFLKLPAALLALCVLAAPALAQKKSKNKQQPTAGGISGRVRVDAGASPAGISVEVRQGDTGVAETTTNAKGEFEVRGLAPGSYGLTLRKTGLQVGRMDNIN